MTLPVERSRAIVSTETFLLDLLRGRYARVPKLVREEAKHCLWHYPTRFEVKQIGTKYSTHFFDGSEL